MKKSKDSKSLSRRIFLKTSGINSLKTFLGITLLPSFNFTWDSAKMPKRILGHTKMSVSLLGFGCTQVKNKTVYQRAIDLGINYFHLGDRDPTYNLEACSALLPFRKKIHIAHMSTPKTSAALFLEDLDNFLKLSGFGYLDIWFVISPDPTILEEFIKAANVARKKGKILFSGITTHNIARDTECLISPDSNIDVVMMTYNYLSMQADCNSLGQFHKAGLGIIPMKPLAGKFYSKTNDKPDSLIRWIASDDRVHTIPIIMNSIEQVEQNFAALQSPFSQKDQYLLRNLYSYNSSRFCRMCGACNGICPYGLAVSDLVRVSMYKEGYQDYKRAYSNFLLIPEKNRQICCDHCDHCVVICPNGVFVKERIGVVKKWIS